MPRVAVLRYGVGNIHSVYHGLRRAGAEPVVVECIRDPGEWDGVVLPGVGAYEAAAARLHRCAREIREAASMGAQVLGICLGMQLLFTESRENGLHSYGLSVIPGRVEKLAAPKLPHIGWSRIRPGPGGSWCSILEDLEPGTHMYFVHSYAVSLGEAGPWACASAGYGLSVFAAAVERPPWYGTQFHPERSGRAGAAVLRRWVGLLRR